LDIEHTNGKRYFTWDSNKFPTPKKMQEMVATKGRKVIFFFSKSKKKKLIIYPFFLKKKTQLDGHNY